MIGPLNRREFLAAFGVFGARRKKVPSFPRPQDWVPLLTKTNEVTSFINTNRYHVPTWMEWCEVASRILNTFDA